MTIKEAINEAVRILKDSFIEEPISISKILLSSVLKKSKEYLLINENEVLGEENTKEFFTGINKIADGIPLQYITNTQEFMKLNFYVDENVLIPQPDTEILVEEALEIINKRQELSILDMCTGSGAIAVSIAKYAENNKICAVDISDEAIEIARRNAIQNNVEKNIYFIQSDMFENVYGEFDLIVSNPPYIETDIISTLPKEVQNEPRIALDGGRDGLEFYRELLNGAKRCLAENGTIAMEIGYNQAEAVMDLFKNDFKKVYCKKDLSGNNRVIVASNI